MRTTEKIVLTSTGLLALTLGMGVSPAKADLIITPVTGVTLTPNGSTFTFGPASDPGGFTASITAAGTETEAIGVTPDVGDAIVDFNVFGNETNTVAVSSACTAPNCTLATFSPGDTIDGSLTFASSGSYKIDGPEFDTPTSGTYYFGLDDVVGGVSEGAPVTDPFGWLEITFNGDDTGTVNRYAFESDTGPAPIPEPATLSVLAVGAAAVLASRRRRKQG